MLSELFCFVVLDFVWVTKVLSELFCFVVLDFAWVMKVLGFVTLNLGAVKVDFEEAGTAAFEGPSLEFGTGSFSRFEWGSTHLQCPSP